LLFFGRLVVTGNFVLFFDGLIKVALGAVGNINTVRLDDYTQEFYPFAKMLKIDFVGMKLQV